MKVKEKIRALLGSRVRKISCNKSFKNGEYKEKWFVYLHKALDPMLHDNFIATMNKLMEDYDSVNARFKLNDVTTYTNDESLIGFTIKWSNIVSDYEEE